MLRAKRKCQFASVSRGSRPISSGAKKSAMADAAGLAGPYASPQPWIPESVEISTSIVDRREYSHCENPKFCFSGASSGYVRIWVIFMPEQGESHDSLSAVA